MSDIIYETKEVVQRPLETIEQEIITLTRQAQVSAVHYACEIGKRLCEAKEHVGHGGWGEWLKDKVDYSQSTAENFMKIYKEYGDNQMSLFSDFSNSQTIGKLDVSKLLLLTSLPADEREGFAEEVDAENISVRDLKKKLAEMDNEIHEEKSKAEKQADYIKTLETENRKNKDKIIELEKEIESIDNDISVLPKDDNMADIQKAELNKIKKDYEEKLNKAIEKQKKLESKKKEAEDNLSAALEKAMTEREAKDLEIRELKKANAKAGLSSNSDLVLINDHLQRLQKEANSILSMLKNIEGTENYLKIKTGIKSILTEIIQNMDKE